MRWGIGRGKDNGGGPGAPLANDGIWTARLTTIGRAIDGRGKEVVDVAISVTDDRGFVSALELRDGYAHGGWAPFDLPMVRLSDELGGDASSSGPPGTWEVRLRAVGRLLDHEPAPLRDVCLVEVEGGIVVETLSPAKADDRLVWRLSSRELATDVIEAAANDAPGGFRFGR